MSVGGARGPGDPNLPNVDAPPGDVAAPEVRGRSHPGAPLPATAPAAVRRPASAGMTLGLVESQLRATAARTSARELAAELRAGRGEALGGRIAETLGAGLPPEPRARLALLEAAFGAGSREILYTPLDGPADALALSLYYTSRAQGTYPKLAAVLDRIAAADLPPAAPEGLRRPAPAVLERARVLAAGVERERDLVPPFIGDVAEVLAAACGHGLVERRAFAERALGSYAKDWPDLSLHVSASNFAHGLVFAVNARLGTAGVAAALRSLDAPAPAADLRGDAERARSVAGRLEASGRAPEGPQLKETAEALAPYLAAEPRTRGRAIADALGDKAALVHEIPLDLTPTQTAYALIDALAPHGESGRLPAILRGLADGAKPARGTGAAVAFAPPDRAAAQALADQIERAPALDGRLLRATTTLLAGALGCSMGERGAFLVRAIGDASLLMHVPMNAITNTQAAFAIVDHLVRHGRLDQVAALVRTAAG